MGIESVDGVIGLDKRFFAGRIAAALDGALQDSRAMAAWQNWGQLGLTYRAGTFEHNIFHDACGSMLSGGRLTAQPEDFVEKVPMDEYLAEVLDEMELMGMRYGRRIGRVRFMNQAPKTCLSLHRDLDECRFHIPIQTNGNAFFVVDNKVCRMPNAGSVYILNTRAWHTAVNADAELSRVHLLFDTYKA